MEKRARKIAQLDPGEGWASIEGEGETAVLTFGSCTGPAREALAREGCRAKLISMRLLAPAQPERLKQALQGVRRVIVVEQNHSGQFLRYLRSQYELPAEVRSLRRPGPLPFRPEEIHREVVKP
jgi:2-oxoglutarate ferredoxin oxidoreductase subunit alpha